MNQLYIPDKLRIGYQERSDTYTKKLAYVIYYDDKGLLRKERSWETWRDKKIAPVEVENIPTEGFVLNKKVGGYKSHWNYRDAHVRVWDPRDFEFEISVPNLLFILTQYDCSRGKGLEGSFVYAWEGTELVLLPTSSEEYRRSKCYTDLQSKKVVAKELIPGATYLTKKEVPLIYLGRFDYHYCETPRYYSRKKKTVEVAHRTKRHVFWNAGVDQYSKKVIGFIYLEIANLACLKSDEVSEELAKLTRKFYKSEHGSKVVSLHLKEVPPAKQDEPNRESYWVELDGAFVKYTPNYRYAPVSLESVASDTKYYMKDGVLHQEEWQGETYANGQRRNYYGYYGTRPYTEHIIPFIPPNNMTLVATLESGSEFHVNYNILGKEK
jgi:hypothetical protein